MKDREGGEKQETSGKEKNSEQRCLVEMSHKVQIYGTDKILKAVEATLRKSKKR